MTSLPAAEPACFTSVPHRNRSPVILPHLSAVDRPPPRPPRMDAVVSQILSCFGTRFGDLMSLLWDYSLGVVTNLVLLSRNVEKLNEEMGRLRDLKEDLGRRVAHETARPGMVALSQVKGWMQRVQQLDSEVASLQTSLERQSTLCVTGFLCLGHDASKKLKKAEALMTEGREIVDVAADKAPDASMLIRELENLRNISVEVKGRVEREEADNPRGRSSEHVRSWLGRVQACLQLSPDRIDQDLDVVLNSLQEVRLLKEDGDRLLSRMELLCPGPPDPVEFTNFSGYIVGGEETLSKPRRYLCDENSRLIGIYGMGGIGKTTLMKKLKNELFDSVNSGIQGLVFEQVIWATVSYDMNVLHIQQQIGDCVGLSLSRDSPARADKQANSLMRALCKKQFLLFLDDLWTKLDWEVIGIPSPGSYAHRNNKIVFTTRSLEVCTDMVADRKVRVPLLDKAKSWQLFRRNFQAEDILHGTPSIRPLAVELVKRCGGLPLSIITVARSMAHTRSDKEWRLAIEALDDSACKLRNMDIVLSTLKFSYDRLADDVARSCLLYCALFPEDQEIGRDELVEYWIGEGLLDEDTAWNDSIAVARGRGHGIISCLEAACLLEKGLSHNINPYKMRNLQETVRMHDTVRHMALHQSRDSSMAKAGKKLKRLPRVEKWGFARRISFMFNGDIREFPSGSPPNCPNLSTLLLNKTGLGPFVPIDFFDFMPALKVLDLSSTRIEEVPVGICSLRKLQYLNLSWTNIRFLPKELGNLDMMRHLDLGNTTKMESVPWEALRKLLNLKVLKMWNCGYLSRRELVDVTSLESLDQLGDLQVDLGTRRSLMQLVSSRLLFGCITGLTVQRKKGYRMAGIGYGEGEDESLYGNGILLRKIIEFGDQIRRLILHDDKEHRNRFVGELKFLPDELPSLEYLCIHTFTEEAKIIVPGGGMILSILPSLRTLEIYSCRSEFKDLAWAGGLVSLQYLTLRDCQRIVRILSSEQGSKLGSRRPPFPLLREMRLYCLPSLSSISSRPLLFPRLEALYVFDCPQLKGLPLGRGSAPKLRMISGSQEWWDGLEWVANDADGCPDAAESVFLPRFRSFNPGKMFERRASRIKRDVVDQ